MLGQQVYHPRYGKGTATMRRKSGVEVQVRFDSGSNLWVRSDELEWGAARKLYVDIRPAPPAPSDPVVQPKVDELAKRAAPTLPTYVRPAPPPRAAHFVKRKVIEALRMGIVPDEGLELFTAGRESELSELRQWLEDDTAAAYVLIGEYGAGKTHLLNYQRLRALEAGYAVALVEMDPEETPFSKPKRVYQAIVRSLQWREHGQTRDFQSLLKRILGHGYFQEHQYFRHLRQEMDGGDTPLWSWIQGHEDSPRPSTHHGRYNDLPGMYSHTTAANIYCYLLSSLGWACRRKEIGLKGVVILFDESEALHAARTTLHLDRSVNFVDALVQTASSEPTLRDPAYLTGFDYAGHAPEIPFLYRVPSGLKVLFAFTSKDDLWISHELDKLPSLKLAPLGEKELKVTLNRLVDLYNAAYRPHHDHVTLPAVRNLLKKMEDIPFSSTRAIVKTFVEALDISRFDTYTPDDEW